MKKKRDYVKPAMRVYELHSRAKILVGSQGSRGKDFEWE